MSGLLPGDVEPIREAALATISYSRYAIASKMDLEEQEMTTNTSLSSKLERLPSVFPSYCVVDYMAELETVRDLNIGCKILSIACSHIVVFQAEGESAHDL